MKILYLIPLLFFLSCATTKIDDNRTILTVEECKNVSPYWYGEKGESPVNNSVWKCFDWEIQQIER